jgi:GNAT superfamily N-acetyltransferase
MLEIRPIEPPDRSNILALAETIPEWFDADARGRAIPTDLRYQDGLVAVRDRTIVGFITLFVAEGRLNIGWLGVKRDCHRKGIGHRLLAAAEDKARDLGLHELATSTLGPNVDYHPYQQTRAFYAKHAFRVYQTSKTDNPGCPEEIKLAKDVSPPGDAAEAMRGGGAAGRTGQGIEEMAGKALIRLADVMKMSMCLPRLGGALVGIGIGLVLGKILDRAVPEVMEQNLLLIGVVVPIFTILGSLLMKEPRSPRPDRIAKRLCRE